MRVEMWADRFTGIPFRAHGRDRNGCDCWGLVRLVLAEIASVELPLLGEYSPDSAAETHNGFVAGFSEVPVAAVDHPRALDIAVFTTMGRPRHVGVMCSPTHVLHVERGTDSVIESIHSHRLARRLEGYYRVDPARL